MAQPSTRQELINYSLRQLGAPVLEINIADEQISDLVDDAIQMYNERHYDGVTQVYLKYEVTQADVDRGKARPPGKGGGTVGIASTSATAHIIKTPIIFRFLPTSLELIKFSNMTMLNH